MCYYHKAYQNDSSNFMALYKHARELEDEGNWKDALTAYGRILKKADDDYAGRNISIRNFEYAYKTIRRIIAVADKNINGGNTSAVYRNTVMRMKNETESFISLDMLLSEMFTGSMARTKNAEIIDELKKKMD